ncbi:hypothetical protein MA16_Dca017438 [Dendrobium catenatum]|uniref:Uncharacterized protein n=1 Tax=Dendrobium catenatum TaxID=906689 RepID=A0A2I0WZI5_9ASPA|nr:hypothetical protein MA16_Dca017438 [Dendrobium catenatum]
MQDDLRNCRTNFQVKAAHTIFWDLSVRTFLCDAHSHPSLFSPSVKRLKPNLLSRTSYEESRRRDFRSYRNNVAGEKNLLCGKPHANQRSRGRKPYLTRTATKRKALPPLN